MANFKFDHTQISADPSKFIANVTDNADIVALKNAQWDRWEIARIAYTEDGSNDTSPHIESINTTVLDDGRTQQVKRYSGFESQTEAQDFINYVYKDSPQLPDIAAWGVANDIRTKIEILDDNNAVIQTLTDNTVLDQHTINGYVERPDDPFFIES